MSIYSTINHRVILKKLLEEKKQSDSSANFSTLAKQILVQKSYVTKVMKKDACWSGDQAFLIGRYLNLKLEDLEYFCLLVELERTGLASRKTLLKAKIKEIRRKNLRSKQVIKATVLDPELELKLKTEYFLDPYHSLVHVFLNVPDYRSNYKKLVSVLGITEAHLEKIIGHLCSMGIIDRSRQNAIKVMQNSVLAPSGSILVEAQQALFRSLSFDRISRCPENDKNSFTVTFTGDQTLQETIWADFLKYIKKIEPKTKESTPEKVYTLQFDLFSWAETK